MGSARRSRRRPFNGRRVVLGVTGGIAAYKSVQLARDLALAGAEVDVVLSAGALEFVRPLSFEALTGRRAHTTMYAPGEPLTHIALARDADLVLIAPATANFIARAAAGMADDLLSAILLATEAPVMICPAMNDRMYGHPQTRANLDRLAEIAYIIAGPTIGPLAWGEGEGPGRMIEPEEIFERAARALEPDQGFAGIRVMVTAGPTREAIDPVRYIGNRSSGRMGYVIAAAAYRRGAEVTLISGPSSLPAPVGISLVPVESAAEMHDAVVSRLADADMLVMAAAVADFRPSSPAEQKLKKDDGSPRIELEPTADILDATRGLRREDAVMIGFALETESAATNGKRKLDRKGLDLIVVNDATTPGAGFDVDTNIVTILDRSGASDDLPLMTKEDLADLILDRAVPLLTRKRTAR
jgi:phosphopantothenoylcysteine decarboxylase/phosphopantothenate--cysteine ligase